MIISLFAHAKDTVPKPREMTWSEFVNALGPHVFVQTPEHDLFSESIKRTLSAFSPCVFKEGSTNRSNANALGVSFLAIDIDGASAEEWQRIELATRGLSRCFYSSWKHAKGRAKGLIYGRWLIEFTRIVPKKMWPILWPALMSRCGAVADPKTKDVNRIFFGAFAPVGTEHESVFFVDAGVPLDWSTLPLDVESPRIASVIPRDRLERVAVRWSKSKEEHRADLGETLKRVCRGEVFAEPGQRDDTIFRLAQAIAEELPGGAPESIAPHFAQSLQIMGGEFSTADVCRKLERAYEQRLEIAPVAAEIVRVEEDRTRIREAFDPYVRDHPYTEEELAALATAANCTRDEWRKRWIIQYGPSFYVWGPRGYGQAYGDKDIRAAVLRDLAPASTDGVELWHAPDGIPIRKGLDQLMAEYGSVATGNVKDMRIAKAYYVSAERLMVEAPCPLRYYPPKYSTNIDVWLRCLFGKHYTMIQNYLALITDLDSPCAALLLTGQPGCGKSLFALCCARLWADSPTTLERAMSGFNETLAHCPLVFGDETLPKDFRGFGRSQELREFISSRSRDLKKKYAHDSKLLGCVRVIIAANDGSIMAMPEGLSGDDIAAIEQRFYHVSVATELPNQWLAMNDTSKFLNGEFQSHVHWLIQNHPAIRAGRFLIRNAERTFFLSLTTRSGIRSSVCQWLVAYLRNPRAANSRGDLMVRVYRGELLVNAQALITDWELYVRNEITPKTGAISQALVGLTKRRVTVRAKDAIVAYRVVDIEHLYAWCEYTEWSTKEEIDLALQTDTPEPGRVQAKTLSN